MKNIQEVTRANIEYHTKHADVYNEQPHFLPETVSRVDGIIKNLARRYGNSSLLDIGCGTGYILDIAKGYFNHIIGIDITQAMLNKVNISSGNIELMLANSSNIPLEDESQDVCTAYALFHHLPEFLPTFKEAFRCLKTGGAFYVDGDPNYYCWKEAGKLKPVDSFSQVLQRELISIREIPDDSAIKYGLSNETIRLAEYRRFTVQGIKEEEVVALLKRVGFSEIDFQYQWFLGEGQVLHNISQEAVEHIRAYLIDFLPLSRHLFKQVSFIARK